jgi:signal transduction histidine kinase
LIRAEPFATPSSGAVIPLQELRRVAPSRSGPGLASPAAFPSADGELASLIRTHDWAATSLGPIAGWPQSLRTTTEMLLRSPVPIVLLWGEDGIMIYNDAYSVFAGGRHPRLLGSKVREGWPEVAAFNDNVMRVGLAGGTLAYKDQELTLHRSGRPEQVFMDLDYSPVPDESGRPAGVIAIVVETTLRVLAARRLEAQQTRLTRMFAQAPGLMALLSGPDHRFELANPAYQALVGGRPLIGLPLAVALPEVARQGFVELLDEVYRSGRAYVGRNVTVRLRRAAGQPEEERVQDFVYQPLLDAAGQVTGIFVEGQDVTERARAEAALRESAARLRFLDRLGRETAMAGDADAVMAISTRLVAEEMRVAVCAYAVMDDDEDGFTIRGDFAREGARSIRGRYSLADFGSHAVQELSGGRPLVLHDVAAELPAREAQAFRAIGLAATICLPLVKAGRLTALMAVHDSVPRRWTDSDLALLTEVVERCWAHVERARAEAEARAAEREFREELEARVAERTAALARSEANIRAIFQTSHLWQGLIAPDGTLLYMNTTALKGIDCTWSDVADLKFWETPWFAATPGMAETIAAAVARVAAGAAETMLLQLQLPSGPRAFDFSLRPVRDEDGMVTALVPEAVDITDRLRTEEALRQAQKMEAIGNLSGGIAHDFNNLLMAVLGSLELLRKRMPEDPALVRLIDNAMAGARRGSALTSRMLAFARRQDLKTERIDLAELVGGMADLLQRSLGPTVALSAEFPDDLPQVETDANQLESALLNLAVNARDAMAGEGRITIRARVAGAEAARGGRLRPGRYVCLAVSDTGAGMDEATLAKAAEPFFTTKGLGKGTGLGLSMVQGLAAQSGGALLLASVPGQGTTAEIWLPAVEARREAVDLLPPVTAASPARRSLRILAVDDDALVLTNTAAMLEDLGHRVTTAPSAADALAAFAAAPDAFDLVVTDHAMPQMTGAQLAAALKDRRPQLPILIATGYAELPTDASRRLPRLSKPFSQAELDAAVRALAV